MSLAIRKNFLGVNIDSLDTKVSKKSDIEVFNIPDWIFNNFWDSLSEILDNPRVYQQFAFELTDFLTYKDIYGDKEKVVEIMVAEVDSSKMGCELPYSILINMNQSKTRCELNGQHFSLEKGYGVISKKPITFFSSDIKNITFNVMIGINPK